MRADETNIYYAARMEAARGDRIFAGRDRAADQLHISTEALCDYERGVTVPPCDVVVWMARVYGQPSLKAAHIRRHCPLMTEGIAQSSELARAALSWVTALRSAEDIGMEFAKVAIDGQIGPQEEAQARIIRQKAVELTRVMQDTIMAIDTALGKKE